MYDFETTLLLARKSLAEKGLPETDGNLITEMRNIQDRSNIRSKDRLLNSGRSEPSSFMDPFSLRRSDRD